MYTFIFLDDALSVGNDATYSPSLHLKTMPKSSFVIDKETTSALFISLTRDTECYATLILTVVVLRTVTEFHVTLSIATDVPLSFHVTLR